MKSNYDSSTDTLNHSRNVLRFMNIIIHELTKRAEVHDKSKLLSPEKEIFDEYTPKLKTSTYGSDEYKEFLKGMGDGLKHHYSVNRHHPEHFDDGINDMNLLDIMEMLCDWKAATLRHNDGDIYKSLEINASRFGVKKQLLRILQNTVKDMVMEKGK
uniref:Uncharacterized protein n=1 Tax=viral metagenome TaxID=1070528 RepID=A0A6H2A625_9ZZZZ